MIRYQRVKWIGGLAIAFCATVVMAQSLGDRAIEPLSGEKADCPGCRATGEACFLGIDPDVYQMPPSKTIQKANRKVDDFITRWVERERHRFLQ